MTTENLGDFLRQYKKEDQDAIKRAEECKEKEKQAAIDKAVKAAKEYLDELRARIPDDVQARRKWNSERQGMVYIIPETPKPRYHDSSWNRVYTVSQIEFDVCWSGRDYYLQDQQLWQEFVAWAKENRLKAILREEGHSERHGDECWPEHDYYYILLQPLD